MKHFYLIMMTAVMISLTGGCTISVCKTSWRAGTNGSFEFTKSGYPANWCVYYSPIKNGDADISFDTSDFIDGSQSFRLDVHKATNPTESGKPTAGLFEEFSANENRLYRISFWMKNQGCTIWLRINNQGMPPHRFPTHPIDETFGPEKTGIDTWHKYEYTLTVPRTYDNIRFEINVVQPGILWIDDVKVEEVQTN